MPSLCLKYMPYTYLPFTSFYIVSNVRPSRFIMSLGIFFLLLGKTNIVFWMNLRNTDAFSYLYIYVASDSTQESDLKY